MRIDLFEFLNKYKDWSYIQSISTMCTEEEYSAIIELLDKLGTFVNINDKIEFIDNGIIVAVKHLNNIGINTKFSCSGHKGVPYVAIDGLYEINGLSDCTFKYNLLTDMTVVSPKCKFKEENLFMLYKFVTDILALTKDDFIRKSVYTIDRDLVNNHKFNLFVLNKLGLSEEVINLSETEMKFINRYLGRYTNGNSKG